MVLVNAESGKGWERVSLNFQFSQGVEVRILFTVHELCMLLVGPRKNGKVPNGDLSKQYQLFKMQLFLTLC